MRAADQYHLAQSELSEQPKREPAAENEFPINFLLSLNARGVSPRKGTYIERMSSKGGRYTGNALSKIARRAVRIEIQIQQVVQASTRAPGGDRHSDQEGEAQQESMVEVKPQRPPWQVLLHCAIAIASGQAEINAARKQCGQKYEPFRG